MPRGQALDCHVAGLGLSAPETQATAPRPTGADQRSGIVRFSRGSCAGHGALVAFSYAFAVALRAGRAAADAAPGIVLAPAAGGRRHASATRRDPGRSRPG